VKACARQLHLRHICSAQIAVEKAHVLQLRRIELTLLEIYVIEDDSFALDHSEVHLVKPYPGEGDVLQPGPRQERT
jgi:hypothetical protein